MALLIKKEQKRKQKKPLTELKFKELLIVQDSYKAESRSISKNKEKECVSSVPILKKNEKWKIKQRTTYNFDTHAAILASRSIESEYILKKKEVRNVLVAISQSKKNPNKENKELWFQSRAKIKK